MLDDEHATVAYRYVERYSLRVNVVSRTEDCNHEALPERLRKICKKNSVKCVLSK